MAIDPGMRYLGVAILEGEELIWYGVKTFPGLTRLPEIRSEVKRYLAHKQLSPLSLRFTGDVERLSNATSVKGYRRSIVVPGIALIPT